MYNDLFCKLFINTEKPVEEVLDIICLILKGEIQPIRAIKTKETEFDLRINKEFDLRDLTKGMLILVIEWINEIRGEILYEDYIYQADIDTLVVLMKNSRTAKFCGDPQDYIKQISGETDI